MLVTLVAEGSTGEFPGTDSLAGVALQVNPKVKTISGALKDPVWQSYIQQGLDKTNSNSLVCHNNAFKIQRFAILPRTSPLRRVSLRRPSSSRGQLLQRCGRTSSM